MFCTMEISTTVIVLETSNYLLSSLVKRNGFFSLSWTLYLKAVFMGVQSLFNVSQVVDYRV